MNRTILSLVAASALGTTALAQQPRILVQGANTAAVHTDLATAIEAAQAGDKLYLSGGNFMLPGTYTIDKRLHFIGAGIHADSSAVTGITSILTGGSYQDLQLTTNTSGSSFTGIRFHTSGSVVYGSSEDDDDPTGMVFQRCEFMRGIYLGYAEGAKSSSTFDECVFRGNSNRQFAGRGGQAVVTRSIFSECPVNLFRPSGLFIKNSVLLNSLIQNSVGTVVQNCIFPNTGAALWQVTGATVTNCLIHSGTVFSNSLSSTATNNLLNVPLSAIFISESDNEYQYSDDLRLVGGSPGIGAGNDGHDIGLYGTHAPFKPGNVPYNPHFRQAEIAPATDWNGALPVNIRTAAQTH